MIFQALEKVYMRVPGFARITRLNAYHVYETFVKNTDKKPFKNLP